MTVEDIDSGHRIVEFRGRKVMRLSDLLWFLFDVFIMCIMITALEMLLAALMYGT